MTLYWDKHCCASGEREVEVEVELEFVGAGAEGVDEVIFTTRTLRNILSPRRYKIMNIKR